jgi:hypothetical protein
MKQIINYLSILAGRSFAKSWNSAESYHNQSWMTLRKLDVYVALRRRLPIMSDGIHWGNHWISDKAPVRATQG